MTDPVDLLFQFSPRPHVAVMTGMCCANKGAANLGDVCVITSQSEVALLAEIEHTTELWKLEKGSLVPEDLKPPRSVFQQMLCLARIYAELQVCVCTFPRLSHWHLNSMSSCQSRKEVSGSTTWNWTSLNPWRTMQVWGDVFPTQRNCCVLRRYIDKSMTTYLLYFATCRHLVSGVRQKKAALSPTFHVIACTMRRSWACCSPVIIIHLYQTPRSLTSYLAELVDSRGVREG